MCQTAMLLMLISLPISTSRNQLARNIKGKIALNQTYFRFQAGLKVDTKAGFHNSVIKVILC